MPARMYDLVLTVPGEQARVRRVTRDEAAAVLGARLSGRMPLPDDAELRAVEAPADEQYAAELPRAA